MGKYVARNQTNLMRLSLSRSQLVVNTRTVLASVPPHGCAAILIEIMQPKRSAAGPHFICCFLISKERYNRSNYTIGILL